MSGRSPDQVVIVSTYVRGYTITHPVPIFSPKRWQNSGKFAPSSPPQERTVPADDFWLRCHPHRAKFWRPDSKSFCRPATPPRRTIAGYRKIPVPVREYSCSRAVTSSNVKKIRCEPRFMRGTKSGPVRHFVKICQSDALTT